MDALKRVNELAAERGLSLSKLATMCGMHSATLYSAVQLGSQLSVDTIDRICQGLDITRAEFSPSPVRTHHHRLLQARSYVRKKWPYSEK